MFNLNALTELTHCECLKLRPMPGHGRLIDALRHGGGPDFVVRASRGGWYRPGRILDSSGDVIADDALAWLEAAWQEADEDGDCLMERLSTCDYILTRESGITHYLVSPVGDGVADFLQLEIEELRETTSHPLNLPRTAIDSVEHLLDPTPDAPPTTALGAPRYSFRRAVNMAEQVAKVLAQNTGQAPVIRFLDEWSESSAGRQRHFCDHWVLSIGEHLDRYRQLRTSITPFAAHPLRWPGADDLRGLDLAQCLHDYDRITGYSFSWYFQMVSGHKVPRKLAPRVHADLADDLAYLPERDAALVAGWVATPYSV